jgi:hypothetical protein
MAEEVKRGQEGDDGEDVLHLVAGEEFLVTWKTEKRGCEDECKYEDEEDVRTERTQSGDHAPLYVFQGTSSAYLSYHRGGLIRGVN